MAIDVNKKWENWEPHRKHPGVKRVLDAAVRDGYGAGIIMAGLIVGLLAAIATVVNLYKPGLLGQTPKILGIMSGATTLIGLIAYAILYNSKARKQALNMIEGEGSDGVLGQILNADAV